MSHSNQQQPPQGPGYSPPQGQGYSPPQGLRYPPPYGPPTQQPKRKRRRVFLWVFLAIQVIFLIWVIAGSTEQTGPTAAQIAHYCGHGQWQGVFTSYHDCVVHGANGLTAAGDIGKGIGLALVIGLWVAVDVILGITYGIYRLARRRD